jgi:hypothetical protein
MSESTAQKILNTKGLFILNTVLVPSPGILKAIRDNTGNNLLDRYCVYLAMAAF